MIWSQEFSPNIEWNIGVSIVSPCFKYPIDLWDTKDDPEIVIITNGGSYMAQNNKTMHFSSSCVTDASYRKPGKELVNHTIGIAPELVYKKLEPAVLDNAERARQMAIDEYIDSEKTKSLDLLCGLNESIYRLDNHIASLICESDRKKNQRKKMEYKMEVLGISVEQIQIATKQKELPYMLTEEREKEEIREERKRKRAEEEKEEERKRRQKETIEMKDGKIISSQITEEEEEVEPEKEKEKEEDQSHSKKLIGQQQSIMRSQEQVIQHQEQEKIMLQMTIQKLEVENRQLLQQIQQQQQQITTTTAGTIPLLPTVPSLSNIPLLDDVTLDLDLTADVTPEPVPGTSAGPAMRGQLAIENIVKPEHLKFLPKFAAKKEGGEDDTGNLPEEVQISETVDVYNLPPEGSSNIIYLPTKVHEKKLLLRVAPTQKRVSNKRWNPGAPVPKDGRDDKCFYCENCSCHYKEKQDLRKHMKWNCMKTDFDYFCVGCAKGFHTDYGVRKHYYKGHKKEFLYFCMKCGKGFVHKSKRSNHKSVCDKKDQEEEEYPARAAYDEELELTFKRRQRVPVNIPPEVPEIAVREEQECREAKENLEKELRESAKKKKKASPENT